MGLVADPATRPICFENKTLRVHNGAMQLPSEQHTLLRHILQSQRVASLASLGAQNTPMVSMVPFALLSGSTRAVIHVSELAAHTANMRQQPKVSVLIMANTLDTEMVHNLPRLTAQGHAAFLSVNTPDWQIARTAYLERFPEAEMMTQLADFQFVAIDFDDVRFVAGFGAARNIPLELFRHCHGNDPI